MGTGGGQQLGENRELSTKVGFALRGGAGYRLGPGIITAEVSFAWAPIDHDITGDSHLGRLALLNVEQGERDDGLPPPRTRKGT